MAHRLIEPHGGVLVDLLVDADRAAELKAASTTMPSWDLTPRQLCDLEMLLGGGFSPLTGFMTRANFESVCSSMRLEDGTLWPVPVTLDITEETAQGLEQGGQLALRDHEGVLLAVLNVEDIWKLDREAKARSVYGTQDRSHPGVKHLMEQVHEVAVAGRLDGIQLPPHYDFVELRHTPAQLRDHSRRLGWRKVLAFQTSRPLHRAQVETTLEAAKTLEANLLLHPVVGLDRPGDIEHYTRIRCYQAVLPRFPQHTASLALLPLALRMAGPREALLRAIVAKNYGCTHFIMGRDPVDAAEQGDPWPDRHEARELMLEHEEELGIAMVPYRSMVYVESQDAYVPAEELPEGARFRSLEPQDVRTRLAEGRELPAWFTYPEVAAELRRARPPRHSQGFTVFFSGLSGAGKSTIANVLLVKLLELGGRPVTLLDGDIVRKNLSSELGFSREHRDINIRRIGFVASEITKNGGIAICAPIAPYDSVRREVREMIEPHGGMILVHVATPLDVCEQRDRKGLYAKARAGIVKNFTGISDPYEEPEDAEVVIDTADLTPEEAAQLVILDLERRGFVSGVKS